MTRSLPRRVHRNLPRAAPPDSWRSLRSARVPPMHYLDKLHRPSLGAMGGSGFDRRNATKLGQNSSGVDNIYVRSEKAGRRVMRCGARAPYLHQSRQLRVPPSLAVESDIPEIALLGCR